MKVLLLGSVGFIGKSLGSHLESVHEVVKVNRETNLKELFKEDQTYDFVINCVSSKASDDMVASYKSNFEYPREFLEIIRAKHWIQLESYFQLQIPMGRRDAYTLDKQRFSEYLNVSEKTRSSPVIHHLFLPHVFGEGGRPERLIASAILAMRSGLTFDTTNGTQYLPLLHISDAVAGITSFLNHPTLVASCAPFWHGQVRDLLKIISSVFDAPQINFGLKPDPIDSNFPRVQFPSTVNEWHPRMQIDEFLEWVRIQGE
jgi:nucleoside-diphosphate-sugar epimerase